MIQISELDAFSAAVVKSCEHINEYEVVTSEAELKDVIDNVRRWPLLVSVLPGATGDDNGHDNIAENNEALFFVLKPSKEKQNRAGRMAIWQETQYGMKEFKEFVHQQISGEGDFSELFWDANLSERSQQPEYNVADCNGWSLLFSYSTNGF